MANASQRITSEERQNRILDMLSRKGEVVVSELSTEFGVSAVTIRTDLTELEHEGKLKRIHGGAVPARELVVPSLPTRIRRNVRAKDAIGKAAAELVHDGDTIQLGIGGIPDAAALALKDKHDLGVHSEMITNSMVELVKQGVITGRKKNFMPGKIVGTFAYGTQALYDLLEENPGVRMLRGETVNDPRIVAQNDNFVSINACLSVDLTGQVCSESIGSRQYSGSGGQSDMAVGATHSKGGRNIIATASTKHGGTVSTITAQLEPGSIVTLSRNELDYVVTEYGIAPLRGRSVRQKVRNLIAVAHPDFRAELQAQAEKLMLW